MAEHDRLRERLDAALHDLGECYRLSGADPDGDENWRLAPYAVEEVKRLRAEYDELLGVRSPAERPQQEMRQRDMTPQERDLGHYVVQEGNPDSNIMQPVVAERPAPHTASDEAVRASSARMLEKHRPSLEQLAASSVGVREPDIRELMATLPRYQAEDVAKEYQDHKRHAVQPRLASPLVGIWREEFSVLKWSDVAALLDRGRQTEGMK